VSRHVEKRVMGLEPTTFTLATSAPTHPNEQASRDLEDAPDDGRSAGAARSGCPLEDDPELASLVAAWPDLPPAIRRAVAALIGAGGDQ
jgi:hypothetical protein